MRAAPAGHVAPAVHVASAAPAPCALRPGMHMQWGLVAFTLLAAFAGVACQLPGRGACLVPVVPSRCFTITARLIPSPKLTASSAPRAAPRPSSRLPRRRRVPRDPERVCADSPGASGCGGAAEGAGAHRRVRGGWLLMWPAVGWQQGLACSRVPFGVMLSSPGGGQGAAATVAASAEQQPRLLSVFTALFLSPRSLSPQTCEPRRPVFPLDPHSSFHYSRAEQRTTQPAGPGRTARQILVHVRGRPFPAHTYACTQKM